MKKNKIDFDNIYCNNFEEEFSSKKESRFENDFQIKEVEIILFLKLIFF